MRQNMSESKSQASSFTGPLFLAFFAGLTEFGLLFSDRPRTAGAFSPVLWVVVITLTAALASSYLRPRGWWWLSVFASWGVASWCVVALLMGGVGEGLVLLGSVIVAVLAGYVGASLANRATAAA
jgi:hypothetical protein